MYVVLRDSHSSTADTDFFDRHRHHLQHGYFRRLPTHYDQAKLHLQKRQEEHVVGCPPHLRQQNVH